MQTYQMIFGKQSFIKFMKIRRGSIPPNLLIHQVQFNHKFLADSPTSSVFSATASRHLPTHPQDGTSLVSPAERMVTYLNPNTGAKVFGTTSFLGGTREQMVENTVFMYLNCLLNAYTAHQQAEKVVAKETDGSEVLTRSSFTEFSGHPGFYDGPFTEQEGQYIIKRVAEEFEKIVDPLDRNFVFTPTLAIVQTVDTRDGEKDVAYNAYFSIGRGIGLDFPTCVGSPQAPSVQIVTFAKKDVSSHDLVYAGTEPYVASPGATPLFQGNALIHPGVTTGGNLMVHANEICRDHSMGYAKQEFIKFLEHWALTDPVSFNYWMNNPLTYHEISSASVLPDSRNLLSTTFALTDQKPQLRGVYLFGPIDDFYKSRNYTQRPSGDVDPYAMALWDKNFHEILNECRIKTISKEPVSEEYGQSGLKTIASDYKPFPAPSLSLPALKIAEEVQQRHQVGLQQASKEMDGGTKPGSPSTDVKRSPDSDSDTTTFRFK